MCVWFNCFGGKHCRYHDHPFYAPRKVGWRRFGRLHIARFPTKNTLILDRQLDRFLGNFLCSLWGRRKNRGWDACIFGHAAFLFPSKNIYFFPEYYAFLFFTRNEDLPGEILCGKSDFFSAREQLFFFEREHRLPILTSFFSFVSRAWEGSEVVILPSSFAQKVIRRSLYS